MSLAVVFAVVAFAAMAWNVVSTMMIVKWLQVRGHTINFVLLKALAPVYAHHYKRLTLQEAGAPGPLFYHWVVSINVALGAGILAVLALMIQRGS